MPASSRDCRSVGALILKELPQMGVEAFEARIRIHRHARLEVFCIANIQDTEFVMFSCQWAR